jgi:hypothetical protein
MKKAIIIIAAVIVVLAAGITSTIAWITSTTGPLDNKFTIGDVNITLTEPDFVQNSKLVPGKTIKKDPKVTVKANSEPCYVFVKIETTADLAACVGYTVDPAWTPLTGHTGVYWQTAESKASDADLPVLANNQITVSGSITKADLAKIDVSADSMKITAYAIQQNYLTSGGTAVTDAAGAWTILNTASPTP